MAAGRLEIRFAVGELERRRSSSWKVVIEPTTDIYIFARAAGGDMKASIHRDGKRFIGLTPDRHEKEVAAGRRSAKSRMFSKWDAGRALGGDLTLEFRIIFPTSELREFREDGDDDASIFWIPEGRDDEAVEVNLLFASAGAFVEGNWPGRRGMHTLVVSQGLLSDGRRFWLVFHYRPTPPLAEVARMAMKEMARLGIDPSRLTLAGRSKVVIEADDRTFGFLEMAADSFKEKACAV